MNAFKHGLFGFALIFFSHSGFTLPIENDAVFIRVIDTGAGLATVTRMPGGHYMIYDAGHWTHRAETMNAIRSVIPDGEDVDLLVLSHSDSDHLGVVEETLNGVMDVSMGTETLLMMMTSIFYFDRMVIYWLNIGDKRCA